MMKKLPAILFMLFVIVACIMAFVAKNGSVQREKAWKDAVLSGQVTIIADNNAEFGRIDGEISSMKTSLIAFRSQVRDDIASGLAASKLEIDRVLGEKSVIADSGYKPTAYCVGVSDGDFVRFDCKRFPLSTG